MWPLLQRVHGNSRVGDVGACESNDSMASGWDGRSGENREARMHPEKQPPHKRFREPLGLMKTAQEEVAERFQYGGSLQAGERQAIRGT
jgi:hypothetical protein